MWQEWYEQQQGCHIRKSAGSGTVNITGWRYLIKKKPQKKTKN